MNKDDKLIKNLINQNIKIPQTFYDSINLTLLQLPNKTNNVKKSHRLKYTFATTFCSLLLVTSVVFAKDIKNYINNLFSFSTKAIDNAIENGYIQNETQTPVYDKDIGIKVNSLVLDDLNLAISFCYETSQENISSIWLNQFTISTNNNNLVYEYKGAEEANAGLAQSMERTKQSIKINDSTFSNSIIFGLRQKELNFDKLYFEVRTVKLEYNDNTTQTIEGLWEFDVALDEVMTKRSNYQYSMIENNDYIKECIGSLSATGMRVELTLKSTIDLDLYESLDWTSDKYFILKNSNNTFSPSQCSLAPNGDLRKIILTYNNIGKFFDNIKKFELYVPLYEQIITLNQISI